MTKSPFSLTRAVNQSNALTMRIDSTFSYFAKGKTMHRTALTLAILAFSLPSISSFGADSWAVNPNFFYQEKSLAGATRYEDSRIPTTTPPSSIAATQPIRTTSTTIWKLSPYFFIREDSSSGKKRYTQSSLAVPFIPAPDSGSPSADPQCEATARLFCDPTFKGAKILTNPSVGAPNDCIFMRVNRIGGVDTLQLYDGTRVNADGTTTCVK